MADQENVPKAKTLQDFELAMTSSSLFENGDLGSGAFGKVKCVREKQSGELYAMKIINKDILRNQKYHDLIKREINIHAKLDHPNIIKLHHQFEDTKKIYMLMELAEKGTLSDYQRQKKRFKEAETFQYFSQILNGIEYLHKNNIMHRDLKPENILFDKNRNIKICDFGWSTDTKTTRQSYCGTVEYSAPEITKNLPYDHCVDIWSLGVLLYEMLHGRMPFTTKEETDKDGKIRKSYYIRFRKSISLEACDLIKQILKPDPSQRLTISEILLHPWMIKYRNIEGCTDLSIASISLDISKLSTESSKKVANSSSKSDSSSSKLVEDSTDANNSDDDDDYQKKKKVALLTKLARRKARPYEEVIDYDSSETYTVLETIVHGLSCLWRGSKNTNSSNSQITHIRPKKLNDEIITRRISHKNFHRLFYPIIATEINGLNFIQKK